ncbi:protein SYS1 [Populus alba x Populus x berolinensis]|nr:protein SYS1 [Populus alba x Populus x berolinensis]
MFYGALVWDPWLIVAQIVCLQCLYYLTLGFFLSLLVGTRVSRLTLVYFFDFATITTSTVTGCCVIASLLLTSFAGAGYMLFLIERANKCLDFSATLYIIHLLKCMIYGGWPSSITWWVVNGTGFAVMALLGEYLCIKRELQEIPTRYRSSKKFLHNFSHALGAVWTGRDMFDQQQKGTARAIFVAYLKLSRSFCNLCELDSVQLVMKEND